MPIAPHVSVDHARLQLHNIRETAASQQEAEQGRDGCAVVSISRIYDEVLDDNSTSSGVFDALLGDLQRAGSEAREAGASEQKGEVQGGAVVGKAGWVLRREGDMLYLVRSGIQLLCGIIHTMTAVYFTCYALRVTDDTALMDTQKPASLFRIG